uniref:Protein kinase domain-containing protein n=1 Tax=Acrobeloides nanus TaxID=290746 RepID=A0A914CKJ9_9BILA
MLCMNKSKKKNQELEEKFHQIELDSGILNFGHRQYNNVSFDEFEYHGILGEGACGVVTKRSYKGYTFAVKV